MGSPPAELAAFCAREQPRLVGALTLFCGDQVLAEEIAQDALVTVCERWERVSQMAAPGAWAHRVAMNAATSRFRRRAAERRAQRRLEQQHMESHEPAAVGDAVAIRAAVARLPDRQGHVLIYRFYLGFSVAETASWIEGSEAAVKSLTQRAVAGLRADLGVSLGPVDEVELVKEDDDVTR